MDKQRIMALRSEIDEHIKGAADRRTGAVFIPFLSVAAKQVMAKGEQHASDVFVVACALGSSATQADPNQSSQYTQDTMFHFADALARALDSRAPAQEDLTVFSPNQQGEVEALTVPAQFRRMYFRFQAMDEQIDQVANQLPALPNS